MFSSLIRRIAPIAATGGVMVFFTWHLAEFFAPPALSVSRPAGDVIVTRQAFEAVGETERAARLTINDELVYREPETGQFKEVLPLQPGENVFVFRAKDRLGRVREVVRRVYRF